MKPLNEELQMLIFDLLEGNLNQKDSDELIQRIQSNSRLNDFYTSLKNTYLEPETIVYQNKKSLIKEERTRLSIWVWTSAVAASIALVIYFSEKGPSIQPKLILPEKNLASISGKPDIKDVQPDLMASFPKKLNVKKQQHLSNSKTAVHSDNLKPLREKFENSEIANKQNQEPIIPKLIIEHNNESDAPKTVLEQKTIHYASQMKNVSYESEEKAYRNTWYKELWALLKEGSLPELKFKNKLAKPSNKSDVAVMICTENAAYNSYIYSENE